MDLARNGTLNNLAKMLSEVGRREEALEVAREAVSLRRDLAAANSDAFTPGFARSLNNLAVMLSDVGKPEKALATISEALEKLTPVFRAQPMAHAQSMAQVRSSYIEMAEALDREPDGKLLEPVNEIFSLLEPDAEDDAGGK